MARLELDFLHPGGGSTSAGWLLLAVGVALACLVGWHYAEAARDLAAARVEAGRLAPAPVRRAVATPARAALAAGRDELDLPWGRLFAALEGSRPGTVALVSIEADGRRREAGLTGEARTPTAMLDYIARLRREPGLAGVVLVSHGVREDAPQRPLVFVVRLRWEP